MKQSTTS
ncbi:hypothetical protein VULLAG_LOCUS15439 [Vulpes lagopus]